MNAQENKRYPLLLSFWVWEATLSTLKPRADDELFEWFGRLSDLLLTGDEFLEWIGRFQEYIEYTELIWLDFLDHVKELFELIRSGKREDLRAKLEADKEAENPDEYDDDDIIEYFDDYKAFLAGEALYLEEEGAESSDEDDAAYSEEDEEDDSEFSDDELDSGGESSDEDDPACSEEDADDDSEEDDSDDDDPTCSDDEYDDDYEYELDEGYGSDDGNLYDEYEESGVDHPF